MKDDINFTGNFTVENNLNLVMYASVPIPT